MTAYRRVTTLEALTKRLPFEPPAPEAPLRQCDADQTRAPAVDERGFVECVHCSAFVPYASMSINEDGCFCRLCAERLTSNAITDLPPEAYEL